MQMNTEISISRSNDQPVSENATNMPQSNGEDENSVIIWYQNENDELLSQLNSNNEDFIDIDMFPEWQEQEESNDNSAQHSPQNITADETNISYSTFSQDDENSSDFSHTPPEVKNAKFFQNFQEILNNHQNNFIDKYRKAVNSNLNEEEKLRLLDSKFKHTVNFCNSANISCYIEGLVAILQKFNRIDCYIEKFAQMTNDCRCTPRLRRGEVTLSHYLLETSGTICENCSMDFILDKLNSIFLKNVARAHFIPVEQIIESCQADNSCSVGATSSSYRHSVPLNTPETGWLRKWMLKHLSDGVVAGIVYNDLISSNYNCRPCNKVMFRLVTGYTDEEFHLTIPVESIRDEVIEKHLLQEQSINVLKSNILKCRHHHEDFEKILKQTDQRFNEMNVLGQIIGTFREESSDSFRGFLPEEVHHIKIPNMHRNGVMLIVNI